MAALLAAPSTSALLGCASGSSAEGPAPGPASWHRAPGLPPLRYQSIGARAVMVLGSLGEPASGDDATVGNPALLIGERASLLVNTGLSAWHGQALLALARALGAPPVALAVVTQPIQEFTMGASACTEGGIPVVSTPRTAEWVAARCGLCLDRLRAQLGPEAMAETHLVVPQPLTCAEALLRGVLADLRLELLQPSWAASPGDLVVVSRPAGVVVTGALGSVGRVPDLRDADPLAFPSAVERLAALDLPWALPGYGPVARPAFLRDAGRYVRALEAAVREALQAGWGLNEMLRRIDLAAWRQQPMYAALHARNVQRMLLRLEARELDDEPPPA